MAQDDLTVDTPKNQFFNFSFFKIDPIWRWLDDLDKEKSVKEVENIIKNSKIKFRSYLTIGLRDDTEFLFWYASDMVEEIQKATSEIYQCFFGRHILPTHVYLSSTRPSFYTKGGGGHGWLAGQEQKMYVIVYPLIKTREWYLLPVEKRREMMSEHIEVGKRYPEIILNTTYSIGIHDQDFMLAFETDNLGRFQDLIMDLRGTQVSAYVIKDTPMIVGIKKDIPTLIKSLG